MAEANERVTFRLYQMECCWHLLCWVNPRHPSYCPNCGKHCYPQVKGWYTGEDKNAHLKINLPTG